MFFLFPKNCDFRNSTDLYYVSSLSVKIKGFRWDLMFTDRKDSYSQRFSQSGERSLVYLTQSVSKGRSGEIIDRIKETTHTFTRWALLINIDDTWPKATLYPIGPRICSNVRHPSQYIHIYRNDEWWTIFFVILTVKQCNYFNFWRKKKFFAWKSAVLYFIIKLLW